MNRGSRST